MTTVNRAGPARADAERAVAFLREVDAVFDVLDRGETSAADAEIDALVAERDAARAAKDWPRADALRDELAERGIELLDTPQGARWRRR